MRIAEVASIVFLAPVIVALIGGPLLGERVSLRTWLALAGGFTGVLLIIRPGGAAFTWYFLLIRAHAHAPATLLSPFGYTQLLVILVLGFLVFGEFPDALGLAGIVLITASGLGLILASRRKAGA
jgi:drug/metabolite transporter (DMT)-like permease